MEYRVSIARCSDYRDNAIGQAVLQTLEPLGGLERFVKKGDRVLLKLNLLSPRTPDAAVTTHPALVRAVVRLVQELGATPVVGDSPGGRGTVSSYAHVLRTTGIQSVIDETGCESACFDAASTVISLEQSRTFKRLPVADAALDADVVIGLPKLKTHQLTLLTGAVKLLYGYLPGVTKAEYHLHAGDSVERFAELLLDLYSAVPPALNIMDAVVGMEGNGPSNGNPRRIGLLLASPSGPALDFVAASILGFDPLSIPTVRQAALRGIGPGSLADVRLAGEDPVSVAVPDFKKADASFLGRVPPELLHVARWFLAARPFVREESCIRCGACAQNCPPSAIRWRAGKPAIDYRSCIRCYCCQELCPADAIGIKRPFVRWFVR